MYTSMYVYTDLQLFGPLSYINCYFDIFLLEMHGGMSQQYLSQNIVSTRTFKPSNLIDSLTYEARK